MEAESELFIEIQKRMKELVPEMKLIDIFNNNFIRSNGHNADGRVQNIPPYPCCFIEFVPQSFKDGSRGYQQTEYMIRFHIGYWSEKDPIFGLLALKKKVYKNFHKWKPSNKNNWNSLLRRNETPNYDHNNVNIYVIDFITSNSDFDVDTLGKIVLVNVTLDEVVSFTQSAI